jgi:predicted glycosyltransferase
VSASDICFLATSKSGLGHLRRAVTIAGQMRALASTRRLHLISNASPEGLQEQEIRVFDSVRVLDRDRMAAGAADTGAGILVLDTLAVPGVENLRVSLALVLRETPDDQLHRFRLAEGRPWDLVVIANPTTRWMPPSALLSARSVIPAGWIYRSAERRKAPAGTRPSVLVATGGGGTADTARTLYSAIDALLLRVRDRARAFEVIQAIGPRARNFGQLRQADRVVDPGGALNDLFYEADIVISTAGYNSVLELATTDTLTLLVPIPRSIDDQEARARAWAGALGSWLDPALPEAAADWLTEAISSRRRRPPADLGPSGEDVAARAILELG